MKLLVERSPRAKILISSLLIFQFNSNEINIYVSCIPVAYRHTYIRMRFSNVTMTRDEINANRVITLMNQLHFHKGESLHGAFG